MAIIVPEQWGKELHYNSRRNSLTKMFDIACKYDITQIALPKIGAGLGGLDWMEVKLIIENVASKYANINLHVVENFDGKI